jgi:alcohol dehydrogenase
MTAATQMRAAVVHEHGALSSIVIESTWPRPTPRPGWVQIRVRACSLNYHDIFTRRSMPGIKVPLPIIIGSDIAGEVIQVGEGVESWKPGDRVLVDPLPVAGGPKGMIGEMYDGGRAEYCLAWAASLVRIPDSVSFEVAASLPLAYATAHRMMVVRGNVQPGETVLVLGASGGVGTACVLLAKLAGARVIACAGSDEKAVRLKSIGADEVINYRSQNMLEAVHALVGKPRIDGSGGVQMAVNYTGGNSWQETIRCLQVGGRLLTCGATAGYEEKIDVRYVWTFELDLMGSNGWRRSDIEALLEMAQSGRMMPVIDKVFPLEKTCEAERLLEDREVFGKIVITP